MSPECREYDHVAPVMGKSIVFVSVEFPVDSPPEEIVIRGERYVRERTDGEGWTTSRSSQRPCRR